MKKKITWQTKIIFILILLTLVGFIQWESWFPLEIRSESLQVFANGGLACGAFFSLVCFGLAKRIQRAKGLMQGMLFLLFPLLILLMSFFGFVSGIMPAPKWKDMGVYKNGGDYMVMQRMDYPIIIDREDRRLIRTASPGSAVRWIEATYTFDNKKESYSKGGDELTFAGNTWHKVELDGE